MGRWIDTELAWAAGFFDGEGCILLHTSKGGKTHGTNKWRYPHLHVRQVDRRPLDRFRKALGFGRVYGPYNHGGDTSKNDRMSYDLFIRRRDQVMQGIACLWKFLSSPKKEQVKRVMGKWRKELG